MRKVLILMEFECEVSDDCLNKDLDIDIPIFKSPVQKNVRQAKPITVGEIVAYGVKEVKSI